MTQQLQDILNWIIYEAGIQPTDDNHFGTVPNVTPRLNLFLQQRPIEIASTINFLLEKKQQGESIQYYGEIGACSGGTAFSINNFLNFKELIIVDDNGQEGGEVYIQQRRNLDRHHVLKSVPRVEIIGSSHDPRVITRAKQLTESRKLDVLFIDGDHSYEGVKQDTLDYYDCVRDGGYILFHDTAHVPGIIRWIEEIPSILPDLTLIEAFKFNGFPYTPAYQDGIGISVLQKKSNLKKKEYDFVEVGTCNFDTLVETATDSQLGLSIEPIDYYLDQLPNRPNVTKVTGALVANEDFQPYLDVYYISEEDIKRYNLPGWIKGCNSIGRPHDFHTGFYPNPAEWHSAPDKSMLKTYDLTPLGIVKKKQVQCYTFEMLVDAYNIEKIKFLKIDTEGSDARIVSSVINYYKQRNRLDLLPKKILFESNAHTKQEEITAAIDLLSQVGYTVSRESFDTIAVLQESKTVKNLKIGISLAGMTYNDNYVKGKKDWRFSVDDIEKNVIEGFQKDHTVSVYLTTYSNSTVFPLTERYQSKTCLLLDMDDNTQRSTYQRSLRQLEHEDLDFIVSTRFDIHFNQVLADTNIDFDKANFLFREIEPHWTVDKFVTDSVFMFPKKYLFAFINAIDKCSTPGHPDAWRSDLHAMYKEVAAQIGEDNCHFIYPTGTYNSSSNPYYVLNYQHPTKKAV